MRLHELHINNFKFFPKQDPIKYLPKTFNRILKLNWITRFQKSMLPKMI